MSRKQLKVLVKCDKCGYEMVVYVDSMPFSGNLEGYLDYKDWWFDEKTSKDYCSDCINKLGIGPYS